MVYSRGEVGTTRSYFDHFDMWLVTNKHVIVRFHLSNVALDTAEGDGPSIATAIADASDFNRVLSNNSSTGKILQPFGHCSFVDVPRQVRSFPAAPRQRK
jgi:hypothetical protein